MADSPNVLGIIIFTTAIGLLPLFVVTMTGFLKIAVVLFLVRNALGTQQTPPNILLYGIALVLTVYVTTPLIGDVYGRLSAQPLQLRTVEDLSEIAKTVRQPVQAHLARFTLPSERQFFMSATTKVWPESARADLKDDDLIVLLPAFVGSELTRAFEIGFLLYLPFLVLDLVVTNVLMALGMVMVSPTLISVPLKLFLFVAVSGWTRLLHGLILSYGG
ncbi:MAG: type III secretion system export apparatus subunit SctR [Bradyrhizobium sp.]|uniref:type III secretion system export apparatus subunit SctR n=1 Tax=Bradyrhizobium sp. TaxID=376 RepID=UPI001DD90D62|nr:type III secretion system export apparatus subunit SctR [Bradyrhizobium sp.]MBV9559150.1 type III secretion system export apparatus subunit SctR [Bradyrhizobium sp.]